MILFVIGVALLGLSAWTFGKQRVPEGGYRISATVTRELQRKSKEVGRRRPVYAPEAEYLDHVTGETALYTPTHFSNHRYESGDQIELLFDPAKGELWHASPRPLRDIAIPLVLGIACIVGGFFAI